MITLTSEKDEHLVWQDFFCEYNIFTKKREEQKIQGVNDYSLLASVLDINDEVYLHSRFLYSVFNPYGNHYQGNLFLKLFLSEIGIANDWLNYNSVSIAKERAGIDIHITDGQKHIIIENKLNAGDQEKQVQRYIEHIIDFYNAEHQNIIFIYLSKNRQEPSKYGLGDYSMSPCKTKITIPGGSSVLYFNVHYEKHIIEWIKKSKEQIVNVQNLYNALSDYEKVVLKSTGHYKSNVMNIKDFLKNEGQFSSTEKLKIILSIEKEIPDLYGYLLDKTMTDDIELFMSKYPVDKINELQFPALKNHIFTEGTGREIITRYQCRYNKDKARDIQKGCFWKVNDGEYKDKIMLTLWMATYWLHVGVIPISKESNGSFSFSNDISFLCTTFDQTLFDNIKLEKRENAVPMPALISWGTEPENELDQIYDFPQSRQGRILSSIFEKLGIKENSTLAKV